MMRKLFLVLKLYAREKAFAFMALIFLLVIFLKPEESFGNLLEISPDAKWIGGLLWVAGVSLTFILGPLIKIQFAQPRAHLVPHYRSVHFSAFLVVGAVLFGTALWGISCFFTRAEWSLASQADIVLSGCLIVLLNLGLSYLSMAPVFFVFYLLWCVAAIPGYSLAHQYWSIEQVNIAMAVAFVLGTMLFCVRLFFIKEESLEYPHLLWKFESRSIGSEDSLRWLWSWGRRVQSRLGMGTRVFQARPYAQIRGFLSRAFYLDAGRSRVIFWAGVLGVLLLPFYVFFLIAQKEVLSIFINGQHKDFFLVVIPTMITIVVSGNRLFASVAERLWPVARREWVWGRIAVLQLQLAFVWAGSFVLLVGVPSFVVGKMILLGSGHFWVEIFLTLIMSYVFLGLGLWSHGLKPFQGMGIFVLLAMAGVVSFQKLPLMASLEGMWLIAGWVVIWIIIWGNLLTQWLRSENNL
ncbi:MAG: hypothetical protein HQL21_08100 [Candidatus Omnitrophica bacterium]|nr:hypothetical protein [Candidatus Omnitrophota bacterium]